MFKHSIYLVFSSTINTIGFRKKIPFRITLSHIWKIQVLNFVKRVSLLAVCVVPIKGRKVKIISNKQQSPNELKCRVAAIITNCSSNFTPFSRGSGLQSDTRRGTVKKKLVYTVINEEMKNLLWVYYA